MCVFTFFPFCVHGKDVPHSGLPSVYRRRNNAKLLHHAQIISHHPLFDGFAISETNEMHVGLLKGTTGGRNCPTFRGAGIARKEQLSANMLY